LAEKTLKRTDKPTARDQRQQHHAGHPNDRLALSEPIDNFPDGLPHGRQFKRAEGRSRLDFNAIG
jgi:hypothetical protein